MSGQPQDPTEPIQPIDSDLQELNGRAKNSADNPQGDSDPRNLAHRHREQAQANQPTHIGPYKILHLLGEGGMGLVYLAEQEKPIHRRVAVKLIKLGMDSKQVLARFETEREALALMNHPNIARVLDAGSADDGRPFFVMDHVAGIPITDYCDKHRLNTEDRIKLFIPVCRAVQHAHQKGIIHRDIKPSNILVTVQQGEPMPKVIDFGVAKATQQRLTERTLFTEHGQLIGTPGYMSPEQAEMTALDIDTRSDVYSLGALLYELLVGARPFDERMLREAGFAEIQRILREINPPKPSTRLSSLGPKSTDVALHRGTELHALTRKLRHDLDWVVMKCLEKDRGRRYDTANALAQDLERFLNHDPVMAGPPARMYRFGKFVRKHRGVAAAMSAIFLVLLIGFAVSTRLYVQSDRDRGRADVQAAIAKRINNFLVEIFRLSDPNEAQGTTITAREILERGGARIIHDLEDQPLVQASLMQTIGEVYSNLGLYPQARDLLEKSLQTRRNRVEPPDRPAEAEVLYRLAQVFDAMNEFPRAVSLHQEALNLRRKCFREPHPAIAESLAGLAFSMSPLQQGDETSKLFRGALEMRRTLYGSEHPAIADSLIDMARFEHGRANYEEAEPLYRKAYDMRLKLLGRTHPQTAESVLLLGALAYDRKELSDAERLYREALEMYRKVYDPDDPHVSKCLNLLGTTLIARQRYSDAEPMLREALDIDRRRFGEEHDQVASDLNALGTCLCNAENIEPALELQRKSLEIRRKRLGDEAEMTAVSRACLGSCLSAAKRFEEAETELLEALRVFRLKMGERHSRTIQCVRRLIGLYKGWGKDDLVAKYSEMLAALQPPSGSTP